MKIYNWNKEKNEIIKNIRWICFEDVLIAINSGKLLSVQANKNYPNQKNFTLNINNYIHICPFVENENEIFLKTVYPDRKFHKKYKHLIK